MHMFRLARLLQEQMGYDWRKKLPVPPDHAVVMASPQQPVVPTVHQYQSNSVAPSSSVSLPELNEQQKLRKFERCKEEGNTHVKKVINFFVHFFLF